MPHLHSAFLRPSCLALSVVSALPGVAFAATDDMTVIATGGVASLFHGATTAIDHFDPDLTIRGLLEIHRRNTAART